MRAPAVIAQALPLFLAAAACTSPDAGRQRQLDALAAAERRLAQDPSSADARIWVGRRQAYLGRYQDAIATYTVGILEHPEDARFYRHRGHRFLTVRRFDRAVADLEHGRALIRGRPDEVEPDGIPNARNQPTSTLHFNVHYHLGLARYLRGELELALASYRDCLSVSLNPDARCATSHWLYMTLRRLGRDREAARVLRPIRADLDVIENQGYHRLLLMYKGEIPVQEIERRMAAGGGDSKTAAMAYGVANWHLQNGRRELARQQMQLILASTAAAAFGHIAAESDLSRWRELVAARR